MELDFNEFETRDEAVEMLENVQSEFGGCGIWENDTKWAVSNCNGFETVAIETFDDGETYFLNSTNIYYDRGKEIMEFIKEYRDRI
jgi:hypothetical protein